MSRDLKLLRQLFFKRIKLILQQILNTIYILMVWEYHLDAQYEDY